MQNLFFSLFFLSFHQQAANEDLNFEEQIVEAAKSITAAAGALVKAATAAQRELVSSGRVSYPFFNFVWMTLLGKEFFEGIFVNLSGLYLLISGAYNRLMPCQKGP